MQGETSTGLERQDDAAATGIPPGAVREYIPAPRVDWRPTTYAPKGRSYGYRTLTDQISRHVEPDPSSRVALHCSDAASFNRPPDGKTHVLLTMWESRSFPSLWVPHLRQADALIVPSRFCEDVFRPQFDGPVYYLPLGVDVEHFPYHRRHLDGPFRWLYCSSPDPRKGWQVMAKAWDEAFKGRGDCELYVKTSGEGRQRVERLDNVIVDTRRLKRRELSALYRDAHGYLFPSGGEGFGFTIAEALATGLPVVGTNWSSHGEFYGFDNGYPCEHVLTRVPGSTDDMASMDADGRYEMAVAVRSSLIKQMKKVMGDYPKALNKARVGSRRIHREFTWPRFRHGLSKILGRYV